MKCDRHSDTNTKTLKFHDFCDEEVIRTCSLIRTTFVFLGFQKWHENFKLNVPVDCFI